MMLATAPTIEEGNKLNKVRNLRNALLLGTLVAVLGFPAFADVNLVQNPGFETGDFTDWSISGPYAGVGMNQLILGVGPFILGSDPGPYSGSYAAYLGGNGSGNILSQPLATTAGQSYSLSFFLAVPASTFGPADGQFIEVEWDGTTLATLGQSYGATNGYSRYTYTVTGTGTDTLLFDAYSPSSAFILDNISVAAPEPGVDGVLALGLVGLAAALRRRKKAQRA